MIPLALSASRQALCRGVRWARPIAAAWVAFGLACASIALATQTASSAPLTVAQILERNALARGV